MEYFVFTVRLQGKTKNSYALNVKSAKQLQTSWNNYELLMCTTTCFLVKYRDCSTYSSKRTQKNKLN